MGSSVVPSLVVWQFDCNPFFLEAFVEHAAIGHRFVPCSHSKGLAKSEHLVLPLFLLYSALGPLPVAPAIPATAVAHPPLPLPPHPFRS